MAFQERSIEEIRDVPAGSILASLTGEVEDFTTIEGIKRYIAKRYDKLMIPFMVLGIFVVMAMNSIFVQPTPFFGWTLGQIVGGLFFVVLLSMIILLLGSSFILTMKSGKGKGNMKFNLRDRNANRMNDIEIDLIIADYQRINRNHERFSLFEDMLTETGELVLRKQEDRTEKTVSRTFASLKGDEIIAEIQRESEDYNLNIPESQMPKFKKKDNENKDYQTGTALVTQEQVKSVAFRRLRKSLTPEGEDATLIQETSPLHKFLDGSKEIFIHIIDFTSQYEYKGKKYPGIIFLHEKRNLQDIFPNPTKAYCMIGWTFGDIPVVTTAFIEIAKYKGIPIFYPTETKDRLLMIANLGFYDENLPSQKTVNACKNLIELHISNEIIQEIEYLNKRMAKHDKSTRKQLRDGLTLDSRALDIRKKIHTKKTSMEWLLPFAAGFLFGFLLFPYVDFIIRSITHAIA